MIAKVVYLPLVVMRSRRGDQLLRCKARRKERQKSTAVGLTDKKHMTSPDT